MPKLLRCIVLVLGLVLLAGLIGPAFPPHALAEGLPSTDEQEDEDIPLFGANFVPPEEPMMSMAWEAGVRTARIQINWAAIEYEEDEYTWGYVDTLVNPLLERGFAVHAVLTLPPEFRRATSDGYMPADIHLAWDDPDNQWARWIGAVAEHYRGRIASYEIWNEPDLDIFWNGSPGQYFELLRSAYPAIKANDPDAIVVMAGMAVFADRQFFPEVLRSIATYPESPHNNYYFDVISAHFYTNPDLLYQELLNIQGLLSRYGMEDKPIWLTETGVPLPDQGFDPASTPAVLGNEEQAGWFILQCFANSLAAGVERLMIYRFQDTDQPIEPIRYGMIRRDLSERPAYRAFRVASTYLDSESHVSRQVINGATIVRFVQPGGGRMTVLWANDERTTPVQLEAHHARAVLVNWDGATSYIDAEQDDVDDLLLEPATHPEIGGPPVIVIESDGSPPTVFISRLPDSIPAGTELALSWSGDDGEFGTGIAGYDVQVRRNDGPWFSWFSNTERTEAVYDVSAGGNFMFRVRAYDGAGNASNFIPANPNGTQTPGAVSEDIGANVTSLPPVEGDGDPFYGANFVPPEAPWIDLAWDAGVRTARIQLNWASVEYEPGVYTFEYVDSLVLPLLEYGYEVNAILTLPPEFRRANPDEGGFMPTDLYLQWDDPDNLWGDWVYNVAEHYEGQISSYEIWNEPDLDLYWDGDAADYAEMLRTSYQAIKAADPDATVVMAGMALREDLDFLPNVVDYIYNDSQAESNDYFFDVAAIHVYSEIDLMYDEVNNTRDLLESYGIEDKPIWVTETNVPIWGEASGPDAWETGYADLEEASWFMVEAFATARAADAERVMVYRLHDVGEPIAYGLLRPDQSERPSYTAYQTAATFMSGVVSAEREQAHEATIVRMEKGNGGLVTVMWANRDFDATVTIDASAPGGLFANADGAVWPADPDEDGTYTIHLDRATNTDLSRFDTFFFGGPPILLIEDDRTPPTVALEPLEAISEETSLAVSWSGDDGPLGTGVASYEVQVQVDDGSWASWLPETTATEAVYDASDGGSVNFRVRARDRAGNTSDYAESGRVFVNGILVAQVLNVRGEPVPEAEITLPGRRTYTADSDGVVRITDMAEGENVINKVDGGDQGILFPSPVIIAIGEETHVTWVLLPRNSPIPNGSFESGLSSWVYTATVGEDVSVAEVEDNPVLQLSGQRRPWGVPSASVSFDVPRRIDDPVLSFRYRLPTEGQQLLVTVIQRGERGDPDVLTRLWQSERPTNTWERVWFDATPFVNKEIEVIFSLEGPKGAPSSLVQIDDVALGSLPEP
jgi:GH35 family endo-1,4-beta-xylanase